MTRLKKLIEVALRLSGYIRRPFTREPDSVVVRINYDLTELLNRAKELN